MTRDVWQAGIGQRLDDLARNDLQVRRSFPDPALAVRVRQPGLRLSQIIEAIMLHYTDRPAVADRPMEMATEQATASPIRSRSYHALKYADLWHRVRSLATWWQHRGHDSRITPGAAVCCIGTNGVDYAIVELACLISGLVSVPLVNGSRVSHYLQVISETRPAVIAVTVRSLLPLLEALLGAASIPASTTLLVIDHSPYSPEHCNALETARSWIARSSFCLEVLDEVLVNIESWELAPLYVPAPGSDPLAQVIYTSGATGRPKGAMCTERQLSMSWVGQAQAAMPALVAHYMPMGHVAGRMVLTGGLARGGTTYFAATDDMSDLLADIALIRPTEVFFIPRVCEIIYDRFRLQQSRLMSSGLDDEMAEHRALEHIRNTVMGGRVIAAVNGSAPLDPDIRSFLAMALQVPIHEAYGSTEAGGVVLFDNKIQQPPVLEYKLADVPELGYFSTDRPYPRGELRLKTTSMITGYFNQPELSKEIFDDEGYYRTGDVMELTGPDELHFVDRTNNVLKLSQAEFVSISRLEALYAASPAIDQIFVHGWNGQPILLAVIVPTKQTLQEHPSSDELRVVLASALREVAHREELNPYEIPRSFIVETKPFTVEGGLLNGIGKFIRPAVLARYETRLEDLRTRVFDSQAAELSALRSDAVSAPTEQIIRRAVRAQIGVSSMLIPTSARFSDLGGDSLSAYSLAALISDIYDIDVPAATILSPATDIGSIVTLVDSLRTKGHDQVTARRLHHEQSLLRADELRLEAFLPAELLGAESLEAPVDSLPSTYFLTGANGFLGRFILLKLLQRVSRTPDGLVYCLVRGQSIQDALLRLEKVFQTGDGHLLAELRRLASRLRIVTGDLSAPDLGLNADTWDNLCREVDAVIHAGALVNHVLPYDQLFGPNVCGTAQVIKMARTHRIKQFTYLSTIGVADQVPAKQLTEDADIRLVSPQREVHDGYANGYANTKWASEVLLAEASERLGVPITVLRCPQILAHTSEIGQINVPDMFTRLLLSVIITGILPSSFAPPKASNAVREHPFNGLPADFIAHVVTSVASRYSAGHRVFNMVNDSPEQPSMDGIADLLCDTGEQYKRLDYHEWVSRLEIALQAQPERIRRHSLLPVLHAYVSPDQLPLLDVPSDKFHRELIKTPDVHDLPIVDTTAVQKWIADIADHDLIPTPATSIKHTEKVDT